MDPIRARLVTARGKTISDVTLKIENDVFLVENDMRQVLARITPEQADKRLTIPTFGGNQKFPSIVFDD